MKPLAVVLASGGMDSCVTTAIAKQSYRLAMLHVSYGQRTQNRERIAFHALADFFQAETRMETSIAHLTQIGGSSLTDPNLPVTPANLETGAIPTSYVPFRNAHLLAIATSWAEILGAVRIFYGAVEEDSSGYPDCREEFVQAFNHLIEAGTKPDTHIQVETPLIHMNKAQIVAQGLALKAPLHLTWSCYQAEDIACGTCDSCALRLRGFALAGQTDPLPYVQA
jgi:7-cyano-7-deazaguanine synthase